MSFRNLPRRREAHFCFTSGFSAWIKNKEILSLIAELIHHVW
jgi:hypothetical protein